MISILLPCYNSEKLLDKVFRESIYSVPTEVIAYDNGGNGKEVNKDLAIKWIGNGRNVGLNAALNECAKHAKYDYFYLPHTDMCLLPGWDTALLTHARRLAPHTFLFCSRSCEPQQGHTPFHLIRNYGMEADEFEPERLFSDFKDYRDTAVVTGYRMPFFLHRKLWEKMGGVDPNYFSYATDNDLFLTAYHVGVRRFWMINRSLVYHLQGKSNSQQHVDKDSDTPYVYFRKKWKAKGYNTDQHIDDLERSLVPWNVKII
jgi:GT2 family glycosyltransferase